MTDTIKEISDDDAYRIVEEMGLGLTFRSCTCGQLPCARLRPLRDALTTARKEARAAAFKECIALAESASQIRAKSPYTQTLELLRTAAQIEAAANRGSED